ncbi:MAG: alpha/beta hydrolase [bacterium]
MKNFKLNGISINDHEGDGPPLIFIHAYPLCSRMWDEQVGFFKEKYRVITYDLRGLGYSNELEDYQFTMEDHVNDLFEIISHIGTEKVNVCGLSIGGYILLRAVLRDESKFNSIILADTKSTSENYESLLSRSENVMKIKKDKDTFLDDFLKKLLSEDGYTNEKLKTFVRLMMSWMDVKGLSSNMISIATRTDSFYLLKNITIPALVIAGRKDELTPVINSFHIKENIKNSVFKVIDNAGHLSNMEKPDEFNELINNFLVSY